MYGVTCSVYLVGKDTCYRGDLDRPCTPDRNGLSWMMENVRVNIDTFLKCHAKPGLYEVGIYIEVTHVTDVETTRLAFWRLMQEANKTGAMTWSEEVPKVMPLTEEVTHG